MTYDETLPALDCDWIWDNRGLLGFAGGRFQASRNHWAVNAGNLHELLLRHLPFRKLGGANFNLPLMDTTQNDLVVVMMPFDAGFGPVYEAIQGAAADAGMRCQRADDLWRHDVLMDEVLALIAEGKIVVCDLSGKNANVFYETGIAHTLGKNVIMLAQTETDVPFDLRHRRYLGYLKNEQGLANMRRDLAGRMVTLKNA